MNSPRDLAMFLAERFDSLRHFKGEHPGWKFAALCVIKLPMTLAAIAFSWHFLWSSEPGTGRDQRSATEVQTASK